MLHDECSEARRMKKAPRFREAPSPALA